MKHTHQVTRYDGSHEQLATEIGDLFYDSLTVLLQHMADKMAKDAAADHGRGRVRLATELDACAADLASAASHIRQAWTICASHVEKT